MFLGGGGSPEAETRVWQEAFAEVSTVLYWPFALPDDRLSSAASWFAEALAQQGIEAVPTTWESLDGHEVSELADFDVIAVGGGLTSKLARHVRDHRFDGALAGYIRDGGTYYGGSAGAILPCDEITIAGMIEDDPDSANMSGLGLLAGVGILPHADKLPRELAGRLAAVLEYDVISLPEDSGIRVDGAELTAIGPGTVRRVPADGSTSSTI